MDIRRLQAFVKIIDVGSISRAADILNIAQPALSQQLASLESTFKQKLLIRRALLHNSVYWRDEAVIEFSVTRLAS